MSNVHSFDKHNLLRVLDPVASQVSANTAAVQPFADGGGADRAVFLLDFGAVGTSLVMAITQATSAAFGTTKAITGATATVLNAAENGILSIEIGPQALDHHNSYTWVRAEVTASGTCVWGVIYLRHRLRAAGSTAMTQHSTYTSQVRVYS